MSINKIASLPLYETKDYNIFKLIKGNRELNRIHVNKLARAIRDYGNITLISPILVNEKYEVIDGQHRLWAMQKVEKEDKLDYTINFIVRDGLTSEDAIKMNSGSKGWNPDDYARHFVNLKKEDYAIFLSFRDRYNLNADVLFRYLSPSGCNRTQFQNGKFKVENQSKSKTWCNRLEEMDQYYRDSRHRSFSLAFFELVSHQDYDHNRMIEQLQNYASYLIKVPLKNKPMKEALIDLYNKGIKNKVYFN